MHFSICLMDDSRRILAYEVLGSLISYQMDAVPALVLSMMVHCNSRLVVKPSWATRS